MSLKTENELYPYTALELDPGGKLLTQANYNSSLEIGALFLYCAHHNCMVKVMIKPFINSNREEWRKIEKLVADDWYNRLVGDIDRTEAQVS